MTTSLRRTELSDFLKARRAAVQPADAGLPAGPRRRTPGLRREEVAVLAGVGPSWYQWLEQGRDISVSPQVLDAVARVLRLTEPERRHLYVLAELNPPLERDWDAMPVGEDIVRLLDGWLPNPAHVVDQYWNLVAANDAARVVFGWARASLPNCLIDFFTNPMYRDRYADWAELAPVVAAQYRHEMTARHGDSGYAEVVDGLLARSPEFAELWARHEVRPPAPMVKTILHPAGGELVVESRMLRLPDRPDLSLLLHTPVAGTATAERIARLVAEDRRLHLARGA
ncbi:helix-turn-helix transcriptional regulator [Actinocatenispora rupis]|uniref:helix-turn-helix transcriptional regulator n=1 Tax=Actinocatenispora rupis TaxID=519421 RepID=UPI001EF202EA|nr:helix-turn-helix transcriptional regulator [Actinocatenispora rupis]